MIRRERPGGLAFVDETLGRAGDSKSIPSAPTVAVVMKPCGSAAEQMSDHGVGVQDLGGLVVSRWECGAVACGTVELEGGTLDL